MRGNIPPPCDPEIFENGEPVALLDAPSEAAEKWVKLVAQRSNARVDWHYAGGVAQVLHLGNAESRERVMLAINQLAETLNGIIIRLYTSGEEGIYRSGVTPVPDNAIGAVTTSGDTVFIIADE